MLKPSEMVSADQLGLLSYLTQYYEVLHDREVVGKAPELKGKKKVASSKSDSQLLAPTATGNSKVVLRPPKESKVVSGGVHRGGWGGGEVGSGGVHRGGWGGGSGGGTEEGGEVGVEEYTEEGGEVGRWGVHRGGWGGGEVGSTQRRVGRWGVCVWVGPCHVWVCLPLSTPQPASARFSMASSDTCFFCDKRVYLMERLSAEGVFFHRSCFRCSPTSHHMQWCSEEPPVVTWCGVVWCGVVWCGVVCAKCVLSGLSSCLLHSHHFTDLVIRGLHLLTVLGLWVGGVLVLWWVTVLDTALPLPLPHPCPSPLPLPQVHSLQLSVTGG